MSVRVSGKHMEVGETFRQRIESHVGDAVGKYSMEAIPAR